MEDLVDNTINSQMSVREFIHSSVDRAAVEKFKQCFLHHSNETLENFKLLAVILIHYVLACKSLTRKTQSLISNDNRSHSYQFSQISQFSQIYNQ